MEEENAYTKFQMKDTEQVSEESYSKKLKEESHTLDDESLHFYYNKDGWEYWVKDNYQENNYSIQLRKKIGDGKDKAEEYWNGR